MHDAGTKLHLSYSWIPYPIRTINNTIVPKWANPQGWSTVYTYAQQQLSLPHPLLHPRILLTYTQHTGFRTDLRLHDSPALHAALALEPEAFWPVFCWDPHYIYRARAGLNRWQYLLDCQKDLSASLTKLNPRSKLLVLREAPQTLLPRLFKAWRVTHLVFEKDTDAYARDRDAAVVASATEAGVEVIIRPGRTLWDSDALVRAHSGGGNKKKPIMSLTQLRAAAAKLGPVAPPLPAPTALPDPGATPTQELEADRGPPCADPDYNVKFRTLHEDRGYAQLAGPRGDFGVVETLAELGFGGDDNDEAKATTPYRGGETRALRDLDKVMEDTTYAATFRKPLTSPAALAAPSTTLLSPSMHFGTLSCRLFYHRAQEAVDAYNKKHKNNKAKASEPPESLTGQLLFRDMYFAAQAALGHAMTQTSYNPQVRFVPWHLPSKMTANEEANADVKEVPIPGAYHVDSAEAETWFQRWERGTTGFPWIDALMRQLRQTGWVHHLGRHSLACFLTRGGCYVHWERGADVFAELLLDHEPNCNAGNWQWLSCTAFFSQYFRCYSPISFPQKWDKEGQFVRHWVPELKDVPAKYIYEPWKAPMADLRKAGVKLVDLPGVLGEAMAPGTYPKPMFDFAERRKICIADLKKAYEVGLHGNDDKVLDGSWRELFRGGPGADEEMQGDGHDGSDDGARADEAGSNDEAHSSKARAGTKRAKGPMDRHVKKLKKI